MFMHERDLVMDFDDVETMEWTSPTDELAEEADDEGVDETTWEWDGEAWHRVA